MLAVNWAMVGVWSACTILLVGSAYMLCVTYSREGRLSTLMFIIAALALAVNTGLSAFVRSPWGAEYALDMLIFRRTALTVAALHVFLSADAALARTNGHPSLITLITKPLEKSYDKKRTSLN